MATADKCNGIIPPDGTDIPDNLTNLMEVKYKQNTFINFVVTFYETRKRYSILIFVLFMPQQIKRIETAVDCQMFCSFYYAGNCTWWLFDETTHYCKIFKGPQEDLYDDCFELGFSSTPSVSECLAPMDPSSNTNCHVSVTLQLLFGANVIYNLIGKDVCHEYFVFSSFLDKITVDTKETFWTILNILTTQIHANGLVK